MYLKKNLNNLLLKTDVDLPTQIANEKKHWQELSGEAMITESQAEFIVTPPTLPFSSNFIAQSLSRLLLYTFDWVKASNNAFKLLKYEHQFWSSFNFSKQPHLFLFSYLSTQVKTVLLQKTWFELFALGMSQCSKSLSLNSLLANINLKFQGKCFFIH